MEKALALFSILQKFIPEKILSTSVLPRILTKPAFLSPLNLYLKACSVLIYFSSFSFFHKINVNFKNFSLNK